MALAFVVHAVRAVRTRRDPDRIRTWRHAALALVPLAGSFAVAAYAVVFWSGISIVLLALSPVGFLTGRGMLRYLYRRPATRMAWFYEHMGAMLGAGIAFHTAFLVFGSSRWLDLSILGPFTWVPWVLPGLVGGLGGGAWRRHYRRKFGDVPAERAAVDVPA